MKLPVILSTLLFIADTVAAVPGYSLHGTDEKCPLDDTRLFREEDVATVDDCAQLCQDNPACSAFSYGEDQSQMICMGCNFAHCSPEEYQGGFTLYDLTEPQQAPLENVQEIEGEDRYWLVGEDLVCPDNGTRIFKSDHKDEDADITLEECYELCHGLPTCQHFSYRIFSNPNKPRRCWGCNSTDLELWEGDGFTTYELKPQVFDYSLYRRNRQCSAWSTITETTTSTRHECEVLCKDTAGCGVFSYGEEFADASEEGKCTLCNSAKGHLKNVGQFMYVLPGFTEGGFNDMICGRVFGDPHFLTFDDVRYDCQGQGEFVLAKSKMGDVLNINSIFYGINGDFKPTVARSVAIKVDPEVPVLHVTIPDIPVGGETIEEGICPFSYTLGDEELEIDAVTYFEDCYDGKAGVYESSKANGQQNVVIYYPDKGGRIQISSMGGGNSAKFGCRMRVEVCLVPENHCDASNIIGMLGTPDLDESNDWMDATGTVLTLPDSEEERRKQGHAYCMENWCVAEEDSLYTSTTWNSHDQCTDYGFDEDAFEERIENADPEIVAACEALTGDMRECIIDALIELDNNANQTPQDFAADFAAEEQVETETHGLTETDLMEGNAAVIPADRRRKLRKLQNDMCMRTSSTLTCDDSPPTPATYGTEKSSLVLGTPAPKPSPSGSQGDPHFKTWAGEHFEYHGQCDMILVKDSSFADGLGLEVQIRTKLVRFWSYIKSVAIRIGDDILEIEGTGDLDDIATRNFWFNFEYQGEVKTLGGFPVTLDSRKTDSKKRFWVIDLSSKYPGVKISITSFREFIKVDFDHDGAFGNTVGLLGDFHTGKTLARDGATVLNDFSELGHEWQVLPSDDMLFHSVEHPQFPEKCLDPEDPQGERRRRLGELTVTEEQAEAACASIKDARDRKDCIYDIIATQDLDMVGAY